MAERQGFLESASYRLIDETEEDLGRANDSLIGAIDHDLESWKDGRLIHTSDDRPIEENDDDGGTSPLCLSTPTQYGGRAPLPPPREKAWTVAFKVNVAFTIISAVWALAKSAFATEGLGYSGWRVEQGFGKSLFFCAMVPFTYPVSRWMLHVMSTWPKQILQMTFVLFVLASVMLVSWMFTSGAVFYATFAAAVCAGIGHVFFRRGRIAFAAENMKVAAMAVRSMPKVFLWSLSVAVIRSALLVAAWIALTDWISEVPRVSGRDGSMYREADCRSFSTKAGQGCECNGDVVSEQSCTYSLGVGVILVVCFWMATMGWGFRVCTNIMTATVARQVSLWWSSPEDVEPLWISFQYVMSSSFGTLCKGSAINRGAIELLNHGSQRLPSRYIGVFCGVFCRSMKFLDFGGGLLSGILVFGASWLPGRSSAYLVPLFWMAFGLPVVLLKLVSSYVVGYTAVFVGMEDLSFFECLGRTKELFRTVGVTVIINEIVVGVGLLVTGLAPIALCYYALSSLSKGWGSLVPWLILQLVLYIYGVIVAGLSPVVEAVLCASKTVFVCFVKDPEAFSDQHDRQLLIGLRREWQNMQLSPPATRDSNSGIQFQEEG